MGTVRPRMKNSTLVTSWIGKSDGSLALQDASGINTSLTVRLHNELAKAGLHRRAHACRNPTPGWHLPGVGRWCGWISWEIGCNPLLRHARFVPRLGKKHSGAKGEWWNS